MTGFVFLVLEDIFDGTDRIDDFIVYDYLVLELVLFLGFIVEIVLTVVAEHLEVVVHVD